MLLEPLLKDRGTVSVYVCVVAMYLRMWGGGGGIEMWHTPTVEGCQGTGCTKQQVLGSTHTWSNSTISNTSAL